MAVRLQVVCSEVNSMFCCFTDIQEQPVIRTSSSSPLLCARWIIHRRSAAQQLHRLIHRDAVAVLSCTVMHEQAADEELSSVPVVKTCRLWSPVSCPTISCLICHIYEMFTSTLHCYPYTVIYFMGIFNTNSEVCLVSVSCLVFIVSDLPILLFFIALILLNDYKSLYLLNPLF